MMLIILINLQMQFPQQTYRWLVSLSIIANEGQIQSRNMVHIPNSLIPKFQNGLLISKIVTSILERNGQKIPPCLENIRPEGLKIVKANNWNFIWISFEDLRMQFDPRIKDLILNGQNALIIEIVKQLCDRDEHKDHEKMEQIHIKQKIVMSKAQKLKQPKQPNNSSLDLRRVNLQKNPDDSQSSLEFLILLLTSAFNMNVEEVLGLFTNQNKYLAHIIVKGINDDFTSVLLFYTLLQKHSKKLKFLCQNNKKDADSCLFAIKPGFISKSPQVVELTLQVFSNIGKLYEWIINEEMHGAKTLFLGMKRHPSLLNKFWELFLQIIQNQQIQYFTSHFKNNFKDPVDLLEICSIIVKPISQCYIAEKLIDVGVISDWFSITTNLFSGNIQQKLLCYSFLGETMLYLPESIQQDEECLRIMRVGWSNRKMFEYTSLLNELSMILEKLANKKNFLASKIFHIFIQIFKSIEDEEDKKEFFMHTFIPILLENPKMPSYYLLQTYKSKYLQPSDQHLFTIAIKQCENEESLVRIGDVLLSIFIIDPIVSGESASLLYEIAKKSIDDEIGQALISKVVKECLFKFSGNEAHRKMPHTLKQQPLYFGHKGNEDKINIQEAQAYKIKQKQSTNLIELVEKLTDLAIMTSSKDLQVLLKEEMLLTNLVIKKQNHKTGSKQLTALMKKISVSKEEEDQFEKLYKMMRSQLEEQTSIKKTRLSTRMMPSSRTSGPAYLQKQFSEIKQKRIKEEEEKKYEQQRKQRQEKQKRQMFEKEFKVVKQIKGFGGVEPELKDYGYWQRKLKQQKQLQLFYPNLMEQRDLQAIENTFKRYHRLMRFLFLKYTSSMHSNKNPTNFEENQTRKEIITSVELMKFLKDYKLGFLISNIEVQHLVREINLKIMNKRQNNELDFNGFQHFIVQFSSLFLTKPHTLANKLNKGHHETTKRDLSHMSHCQLVEEFFKFLRLVFVEKGQKTIMFDEPEAAYFNEGEVIKQYNKRLQENPSYILPEGYKKITQKFIKFQPVLTDPSKHNINEAYTDVFEILDEIFFQSPLRLHIMEPKSEKITKARVKPTPFLNIKSKLNADQEKDKARIYSSITERKIPAIPPIKMLERKVFSFGMKLGLSQVSYKDKLLGEQVAYVIDDMLTAIETGKSTIKKQKIENEAVRKRRQQTERQKKEQQDRQKKIKDRRQELQQLKKSHTQKKVKELQDSKQERQRKKQKEKSRERRKRQQMEKYINEQKVKLKQKKQKDQELKEKKRQDQKKKKQEKAKAKEKYEEYNKLQIQRLKKQFQQKKQHQKKKEEEEQETKKHKQELYKKLRNKGNANYQKFKNIQNRNNQQIAQLYTSAPIAAIFQEYHPNIKALFDFLIRNTYQSLTDKKHNNEIIHQTWNFFVKAFELTPYMLNTTEIAFIFVSLTKEKQISKQYKIGLNFKEFEQALLRIAIKHKTIFNKIAQNIKDQTLSKEELEELAKEKSENQFENEKGINAKTIGIEDEVIQQAYIDYGDISKVTPETLKGLIYYLKVPKDKLSQQKKWKQILEEPKKGKDQKFQKLKQKLKAEYSLSPTVKKKEFKRKNLSQVINLENSEEKEEEKEGEKEEQKKE